MDDYAKELWSETIRTILWFAIICLSILLLFVGLASAFGPTEEQQARDHAMQVIAEKDGCKVYRFYDGNYHYITRCGDKVITRKNWEQYCGKACVQHKTEDITTEGNQ